MIFKGANMAITKKELEDRLAEINVAIERMMADVNAAVGRREEIKFHIAKIFEEESKKLVEEKSDAAG